MLLAFALSSAARAELLVESVLSTNAATATLLAGRLAAPGIGISNAALSGVPEAIGTFSAGATVAGFELDQGIVLSSGSVGNAVGPNDDDGSHVLVGEWGGPGDDDLAALHQTSIVDAALLEFDFSCPPGASAIHLDYIFASEEYDELDVYDALGIFVDGVNAATLPGTSNPINADSVSATPALFKNNNVCNEADGVLCPFDLQADGFSVKLTAEAAISLAAPSHSLEIVVGDEVFESYDSWVFLSSLRCILADPPPVPGLGPLGAYGLGGVLSALTCMLLRRHRRSRRREIS